jgi:hypothetical protein
MRRFVALLGCVAVFAFAVPAAANVPVGDGGNPGTVCMGGLLWGYWQGVWVPLGVC